MWTESSSDSWNGWSLTQAGGVEGLSVVNNGAGTSSVFVIGADQQVYFENSGTPYSPWASTVAGTVA